MRTTAVHLVTSNPLAQGNTLAVPIAANAVVIASGTLSASFVSPPFDILQLNGWSATVSSVGVNGIASWQVCNDIGNSPYNTTGLVNWVTYPNIDIQMTDQGLTVDQAVWNLQNQFCHFIRFTWTHQSGTGSIDVSVTAKGLGA